MYYHEAMQQSDKKQFKEAMVKEFIDHTKRKHWELCLIQDVPQGIRILNSIWSMKRKRNIITRQVMEWKARLTVYGDQQKHGVNYTRGIPYEHY